MNGDVQQFIRPRMTYYTKVVDNIDGHQILGYASSIRHKRLYYGRVDALNGGESQYVISLDVWNNEPGWSGGTPLNTCQNAVNCRLRLNMAGDCRDLSPFLYARCVTADPESEFSPLHMGRLVFDRIRGNAAEEMGVINGDGGDHATIETKIRLKKGCTCRQNRYPFELTFAYNYNLD